MNILMFEMKNVCYNSYIYFTEALSEELVKQGHSVEIFSLSENNLDDLEQYVGQKFDALIDFNSDLPRALLDDDSYFLDKIDSPFFNILLDHPLYHHDSLKHKLQNYHVVCLDSNHKSYVEKYYPHIKSITVTPMTGGAAFEQEYIDWDHWENREYKLIFTGSYTSPQRIEKAILALPEFLQENVYTAIDIIKSDQSRTIESVVEELSEMEIYDYIKLDIPLHTQTLYLADAYIRTINRHNLIKELDKCKYPLHLFGTFWNEIDLKNAIIHKELPFNLTFTIFNKAQISANIMPNFKAGAHDRIFSSQLNGAASLTDTSSSLIKEYSQENIIFYKLEEMNELANIVNHHLDHPDSLKKIAQAGFEKANQSHTWTNICNIITESITNA